MRGFNFCRVFFSTGNDDEASVLLLNTNNCKCLQGAAFPPLPSNLNNHIVHYVRHEVVPVGKEVGEAGGHEVYEIL